MKFLDFQFLNLTVFIKMTEIAEIMGDYLRDHWVSSGNDPDATECSARLCRLQISRQKTHQSDNRLRINVVEFSECLNHLCDNCGPLSLKLLSNQPRIFGKVVGWAKIGNSRATNLALLHFGLQKLDLEFESDWQPYPSHVIITKRKKKKQKQDMIILYCV